MTIRADLIEQVKELDLDTSQAAEAGIAAAVRQRARKRLTENKAASFKFERFEISVFSDGHLAFPTRFLARKCARSKIKAWLGQTVDMVSPPNNVTLVRTPTETILFDVGAGPHFMPCAGKLAPNMEAMGFDSKNGGEGCVRACSS